jgi:hypothetical protein
MPGSSSGQLATSAMHHPLMDPKERRRECFAALLAESTPQGKSQAMVIDSHIADNLTSERRVP